MKRNVQSAKTKDIKSLGRDRTVAPTIVTTIRRRSRACACVAPVPELREFGLVRVGLEHENVRPRRTTLEVRGPRSFQPIRLPTISSAARRFEEDGTARGGHALRVAD